MVRLSAIRMSELTLLEKSILTKEICMAAQRQIPIQKKWPQRRARRYLLKPPLVDQTARHQTVRSNARKAPNLSALETPTPFRAGIFLSYTGSQIRHGDRRTTSRSHENRSNAYDIEMIMRHRLPPIEPMSN